MSRGNYGYDPFQGFLYVFAIVAILMLLFGCERAGLNERTRADKMYVCTFERIDGNFYGYPNHVEGRSVMVKVYRFPTNNWHDRREFMFPRIKLEQCEYQKGE